jgi:phosphoglycolate phosphatase
VTRKLVLFDIDGTILLTAGAGRRAIIAALSDEVGPVPAFQSIRFDGKTDPQIVAEMLDMAGQPAARESPRVRALCERYVGYLALELERPTTHTTIMPGVPDLLDRLEGEPGVVLGLLTGNLERGAALKLRSGGISPERFRVGAYGSDAAHRPDLPPIAARRAEAIFGRVPRGDEVVIIGDTPADVRCGLGIGARGIGVGTAAYTVQDLMDAGAAAAFGDLSDTEAVVEAILA